MDEHDLRPLGLQSRGSTRAAMSPDERESTSRLDRLRARGPAQRRPHWKVTVLVPFGLVTMLDVIGCEPYFRQ